MVAQLGGTNGYAVLNVPFAPRAAGVGGNLITARDGDINLGLVNPALLDSTSHQHLSVGYFNYYAGTNAGYAAYAHHAGKATFAGGVHYLGYGDLERIDEAGNSLGNFSAGDFIGQVSASLAVDTAFSVGATAKFIYSTIGAYSSAAAAIDLGANYWNPHNRFSASLLIKNLGGQFNTYYGETKEQLPFEVQLGISKQLEHAPFRFSIIGENLQQWDLTYINPNATITVDPITGEVIGGTKWEFGDQLMRHIVIGTELLFGDNFSARLGYNYRRRQELKVSEAPGGVGLSWGFGVKVKKFELSYSRATYHQAGGSNQFSLATRLSNW